MRHRIGIVLAVLVCALSAVSAQTGVTDTIDLDKRLDKKVTIEVVHTDLADVASELTKQTGVTIKAGTSAKDWKSRERKVTIFAKDISAGELLKKIAVLLDFELTASGKERQWEYRFWLDRKSRLAEDDAVAASEKADEDRIAKTYQAALDQADEALGLTPSDALSKRASSPWLAFLGGTDTGRACARILSYLNKQGAESRSRFLAGKIVELSVADLPAEVQQAVRQAATGRLTQINQNGGPESVEVTQVSIWPAIGDDSFALSGELSFDGTTGVTNGDGEPEECSMGSLPIANPNSPMAGFLGEFALRIESGDDPESLGKEIEASLERDGGLLRHFFNHDSPTRDNPPTDPELTREIEIKKVDEEPHDPMATGCDPELAGEYVREISRATGWSVLFESFDSVNNFTALIVPGKQPLYKVLVALEETGYLWKREDGTLLVWPEDRLVRRAPEISEALVAQYERLWETQDRLSLDDHARLVSSLTDLQLTDGLPDTRLHEMVDPSIWNEEPGYREMLRLYYSLSRTQKALLVTEEGLPLAQLGDQQWQHVQTILADEMPEASPSGGLIKLRPTDEGYAELVVYVIEQGTGGLQLVSYQYSLPSRSPEDEPMEEQL